MTSNFRFSDSVNWPGVTAFKIGLGFKINQMMTKAKWMAVDISGKLIIVVNS